MRRVEAGGTWSLFDPSTCPGLSDAWGDEFAALYERYEAEGLAVRQVPAQDVWFEILRSQIETGTPYLLYKDAANAKSNQQNLGTIKTSNLCAEILEYTSADECSVCNLGSLCLPAFVVDGAFDFEGLLAATRVLARNLDRVIDITFYPIEEARRSNLRHRPVGIGVQGLQDVFFKLRMPYESAEAAQLNRQIFQTIYFAAISESCQLARELGAYSSFRGSPASQGRLQFDLWGVAPDMAYSWDTLKADVREHGLRNSLSVAPMPTASTAAIFGNTESTEPITSNMFSRRTLAGEFAVVNKYLVADLAQRGLWSPQLKNAILANDGSIQNVRGIPDDLKALYKTAWELSMKLVIDMAADRGAYVCQTQSMNLFVAEPTFKKLSSMHFYAWRRGLKTGQYYLRSRPAAKAVQITVSPACLDCSA
jgi:ribonucleoside-diphosphate reductase alpha subunit